MVEREEGELRVKLSGYWAADQAPAIECCVPEVLGGTKAAMPVVLDLASIERLDTIGAWIIDRTLHDLRSRVGKAELVNVRPRHDTLLREVEAHGFHVAHRESHDTPEVLVDIGKGVSETGNELVVGPSFLGEVMIATARLMRWRRHFRAPAFVHQMELIILRGVPIIVLISFVVGGIIAQQGIFQLRRFDAADFAWTSSAS
ncbi:phospholipid/cholesterol/gamma-HCH transport system permease protein [Rhizobiales bacterium GAS113]|nr:phospholipid/cholesterol/gamma-HCH transport system permease protein [Rhizobiales bacterium GAS113]